MGSEILLGFGLGESGFQLVFQVVDINATPLELAIPYQVSVQGDVASNAVNQEFVQRNLHPHQCLLPGAGMADQLRYK
tara:strand:+ start:442 stop:675 length:234 start_codon:yes stop_codon:yes gene_type:complete